MMFITGLKVQYVISKFASVMCTAVIHCLWGSWLDNVVGASTFYLCEAGCK